MPVRIETLPEGRTHMKFAISAAALAALASFSIPAHAQETEGPAAAPEEMAPVTDAELENFVRAAAMMKQIQQHEELSEDDKKKGMLQVLAQAKLTPQRFNAIGQTLQKSPELQKRTTATIKRLQAERAG